MFSLKASMAHAQTLKKRHFTNKTEQEPPVAKGSKVLVSDKSDSLSYSSNQLYALQLKSQTQYNSITW